MNSLDYFIILWLWYILSVFIDMIVYCILYYLFNFQHLYNIWLGKSSFSYTVEADLSELMKYTAVQNFIWSECWSFPPYMWNSRLLSSQLDYSPCRDNDIPFIF